MILGLTMGFSATAFAASADSFSDVPKDHWSYEALDALAKDGIIEGYPDGTFQGNRTMSRYEVATIVAKAMGKTGSIGDQAILEKLEREYGTELEALNKKIDAVDKKVDAVNQKADKFKVSGLARVQSGSDDGVHSNYNNRFYMDLEGEMKVSDMWKARFTIEKNAHYKSSEPAYTNELQPDGTYSKVAHTHAGKDNSQNDQDHNGSVSNVWVEGTIANNWYVNMGRKWNGIGYQNLLWGNPCDGVSFYHPVGNGDWMVSGDVWSPTWDGAKYTMAAANVMGKLTKTIDTNIAYARIVNNKDDYWTGADQAISVDLRAHLTPTLTATASYVKTNAELTGSYWKNSGYDRDFAYRLDYKGTNLNNVGSFGMWARYVDMGVAGDFGHDDEWTTRGPSYFNGTKGWYLGVNYVPWQNVEWSTMYGKVKEGTSVADAQNAETDRRIIRTQLDFHF